MIDRHKRNIDELNLHLKHSRPMKPQLSASAYVEEVTKHLARIRPPVAVKGPQRP